jgi:hypothetical protein
MGLATHVQPQGSNGQTTGGEPKEAEKLDAPTIYEGAKSALARIIVTDVSGVQKQGSGLVLRADGLIATNFHVIRGAVSASVKLANGDVYDEVAIAASDDRRDIALLKIRATNLPSLSLANSDELRVGATVYALGAPLGLEGSLSEGLVSAIRPASEISSELQGFRVIQFTAPSSHGSSGGPLLDESGKVEGLVTSTLVAGQNLNFAIPANYVAGLVSNWNGQAQALARMVDATRTHTSRSAREVLAGARSLCIVQENGSPVIKAEIEKKLLKWGRLTLLSSVNGSDLVLVIAQTGQLNVVTGEGNQAAASLKDQESGAVLWSTTKGGSWSMRGYSNAWVGRAIADELTKFLASSTKGGKK